MKRPAFLIATEDATPEQVKARAQSALAAFTQAIADNTTTDHREATNDQHERA